MFECRTPLRLWAGASARSEPSARSWPEVVSLRPISLTCLGLFFGGLVSILGELGAQGVMSWLLPETAASASSCDCLTPGISRDPQVRTRGRVI